MIPALIFLLAIINRLFLQTKNDIKIDKHPPEHYVKRLRKERCIHIPIPYVKTNNRVTISVLTYRVAPRFPLESHPGSLDDLGTSPSRARWSEIKQDKMKYQREQHTLGTIRAFSSRSHHGNDAVVDQSNKAPNLFGRYGDFTSITERLGCYDGAPHSLYNSSTFRRLNDAYHRSRPLPKN